MKSIMRAAYVAALVGSVTVRAACTSNVQVDNFHLFASGSNSLGSPVGDDGTMQSITASTANGGSVTFTPKAKESYFYESFVCRQATTEGYGALSFTLQGPVGGSLAVELQTQANCSATEHTSSYNVVSDLTGNQQQITLPLSSFDSSPNTNAIVAVVFSEFVSAKAGAWSVGNIQFVCGSGAGTTVVPVPTTTTRAPTTSLTTSTRRPSTTTTPRTSTTTTPRPSTTTRPTSTSTPRPSTTSRPTTSSSRPPATPTPSTCSNLLIDDWTSQSRLTFLNYNALKQSTSDDGTMKSIAVENHGVTLTPTNKESYFYSEFGCLNAQNTYGGISFRIKAAAGTTFSVQLSSVSQCGGDATKQVSLTSTQLKWAFDGTDRLYWFPFSVFTGVDVTKLEMIYFTGLSKAVRFGPMSFYCGTTATEYILPPVDPGLMSENPVTQVSKRASLATMAQGVPFVLDDFADPDANALGMWHGGDDGMTVTFGRKFMTVATNDSDLGWSTTLAESCVDFSPWKQMYLHIAYSGSNKFSVALQQHNLQCNEDIAPFPETWDSLEAARYANATDIYMPIAHFNINATRAIGFSLKGFYSTTPTKFSKMEIVSSLPKTWGAVPPKLPSGQLVFACKRPNSFAFAIDDGEPELAQQVMDIVKAAGINVTFFTVGLPLLDPSTNLSAVYKDMYARGHQIALHSYTHPKMEGLPDTASIDWEYNNDIGAVKQVFGKNMHTPYFRPPFGTEGARMRQRLVNALGTTPEPYIVQWSIDVEDWIWAESKTPEKQLDAFKRDLAKGGNLVVMHYLYPSTVGYLKEFIRLAKATGKQLMRVDQCMMDPNAPPLPK